MDNFYHQCPPMMNDGRFLTDFRSSTIREELFKYKFCAATENEARTLRMDHGEKLLDDEWKHIKQTKYCYPRKQHFHLNPSTRVSSQYNNMEIRAYNGELAVPTFDVDSHDYRSTVTSENQKALQSARNKKIYAGYIEYLQQKYCPKSNRILPENLRGDE
jgi:hypothetical protein